MELSEEDRERIRNSREPEYVLMDRYGLSKAELRAARGKRSLYMNRDSARRPDGTPRAAKLSQSEVLDIFESAESRDVLAARYRISVQTIRKIQTGRAWACVTGGR